VNQLLSERKNQPNPLAYPHEIDMNLIPHGGEFTDNAYTTEEMKLLNESRKILESPELRITATVVRVPVTGGHSISANISFKNEFEIKSVLKLLYNMHGVIVQDDIKNNVYPMPKYAYEKDDVFVGRIRRDFSAPRSLNMWIVADNLRKGAATNAVQIMEYLISKKFIS
jgi:aspartate-semialdehyde dehydrogenase